MKPRTTTFALAFLVLWFGTAIFVGAQTFDLDLSLLPLSLAHPFGTDAFGRDLLKLTLFASKQSAFFALLATVGAVVIGMLGGGALPFLPRRLGYLCERLLDFFLAFPGILIALGVQAVMGPGMKPLLISLSVGLLPSTIRFVSAKAKEVMTEDYVEAARALGTNSVGLFLRHLRPALWEYLRLKAPSLFAQCLLMEATLSFLSLGAPPGTATWGSLLSHGKDYLIEAPTIAVAVGFPLVLTILCLQSLTDRSEH